MGTPSLCRPGGRLGSAVSVRLMLCVAHLQIHAACSGGQQAHPGSVRSLGHGNIEAHAFGILVKNLGIQPIRTVPLRG